MSPVNPATTTAQTDLITSTGTDSLKKLTGFDFNWKFTNSTNAKG